MFITAVCVSLDIYPPQVLNRGVTDIYLFYKPALKYYGAPKLIGPMVYLITYIFNHFYQPYSVLLTMVPRNSHLLVNRSTAHALARIVTGNILPTHAPNYARICMFLRRKKHLHPPPSCISLSPGPIRQVAVLSFLSARLIKSLPPVAPPEPLLLPAPASFVNSMNRYGVHARWRYEATNSTCPVHTKATPYRFLVSDLSESALSRTEKGKCLHKRCYTFSKASVNDQLLTFFLCGVPRRTVDVASASAPSSSGGW